MDLMNQSAKYESKLSELKTRKYIGQWGQENNLNPRGKLVYYYDSIGRYMLLF